MTEVKSVATKAADLDISVFDSEDEADMVVMHPATGEPTTWIITFAGPGHPQAVAHAEKMSRERLREEREKEQARVNGRKWKAVDETLEESRQKNLSWIASRMLRWTPVKINGIDYPFSAENAIKLLSDPRKGTLFQQCLDFVTADTSFIKGSAKI